MFLFVVCKIIYPDSEFNFLFEAIIINDLDVEFNLSLFVSCSTN
jgi:hypothetical protein